ncbi:MAG TPA: energy transducer TonB [Terracidiphilus sp.]|nr:energy transducer TonB [Terracidiphilus sp.]
MRHIITSTIVLSSLLLPAAAAFARSSNDIPTITTAPPRVSTGVTGPVLQNSFYLVPPFGFSSSDIPAGAKVGVSYVVNAKGLPENIQVTKSLNPVWDAQVVEAVSKLHYRPARIDDQKIPIDMNLTVVIAR